MINCPTCEKFNGHDCEMFGRQPGMAICPYAVEQKPRNHFEEIKAMSMEQMAEFFTPFYYKGLYHFYCPAVADVGDGECSANDGCRECFAKWLKEEITDAETE
jgi:hypothetical protein